MHWLFDGAIVEWSPDGSLIVSSSGAGIYAVDINSSEEHTIVSRSVNSGRDDRYRNGGGIGLATHFDISPDGSKIAYSTCRYPGTATHGPPSYWEFSYEIVVSNIDGSNTKRLTRNDHFDNFPAWSPDGTKIAFFSDRDPAHGPAELAGRLVIYDMETGQSRDIVLPLGDRVAPHPPAWSPDGRRIALVAFEDDVRVRRALYTVEADGSNLARISYAVSEPSWSPDGQRIAVVAVGNLYTFAPDGSDPVRIARVGDPWLSSWLWQGRASWSPDGSQIMYTKPESIRRRLDNCRVCIATVDGSLIEDVSPFRLPSRYARDTSHHRLPERLAWSPDGSRIAVQARSGVSDFFGNSARLLTIDRDGNDPRILRWSGQDRETVDPGPADIEACSNGVAVPDPEANPGLVEDCRTLLGIREELGGSVLLKWSPSTPTTGWEGIAVGGEPPRVHAIEIYQFFGGHAGGYFGGFLYGRIPPELGNLTELRMLNLSLNELSGHIPPELGNLANLEVLDLRSNLLTGRIPLELGSLENLRKLYLSGNRLTGCIPLALRGAQSDKVRMGINYCYDEQ